ncbi:ribosomal protein S20 [Beggiatoa alba B18LD]|uniref:Small ribosomal subunit protein bS20 n=1 Tax=Beggiatoa alba B18LD TaxID=395493 RepID=I3CKE8_9GAMM|nr:30S ribosomal protein S20 [Beggiatoa alba]EIJ44091.1 ribosomal protein S20 [Beggiatoa alba B18LD]
MANSAQAKKRVRQSEAHRQLNAGQRTRLRTSIKNVVKALATGNVEAAKAAYAIAVPVIDGMAHKGLIHKNKAARHKSRLNSHIRSLSQQAQA